VDVQPNVIIAVRRVEADDIDGEEAAYLPIEEDRWRSTTRAVQA